MQFLFCANYRILWILFPSCSIIPSIFKPFPTARKTNLPDQGAHQIRYGWLHGIWMKQKNKYSRTIPHFPPIPWNWNKVFENRYVMIPWKNFVFSSPFTPLPINRCSDNPINSSVFFITCSRNSMFPWPRTRWTWRIWTFFTHYSVFNRWSLHKWIAWLYSMGGFSPALRDRKMKLIVQIKLKF